MLLLFLVMSGLAIVLGERQAGAFMSLYTCSRWRWVPHLTDLPPLCLSKSTKTRFWGKLLLLASATAEWHPHFLCSLTSPDGDQQRAQGHGQNEVEVMPETSGVESWERVECSRGDKGLERWVGFLSCT